MLMLLVFILVFLLLTSWIKTHFFSATGKPPSPPSWPIIGHLHLLGKNPHRSLANLAQRYGPVMELYLGTKKTWIISSPSAAKELLKNNDRSCSSRSVPSTAKTFSFGGTSLVFAPYGDHWRFLRRITVTELFTSGRLDATVSLRREKVKETMLSIFDDSREGKTVNIGSKVFLTTLGLIEKMVRGKKIFETGSNEAIEFKEMVWKVLELSGRPNFSDFFPKLGFLDLQGLDSEARRLKEKFNRFFDQMIADQLREIKEREKEKQDKEKCFLEILLEVRNQNPEFKMDQIKGMLMDMFIAGTDTTSATVEWGMAELLRHPDILKRTQAELDKVIGDGRWMEELHVPQLPFLQAVVKEVMRLHPAAPLMLPRWSDVECQINGWCLQKNTQILVNVWGIGRDQQVWKEPTRFKPERFMGTNMDFTGKDFELLTFGTGRRICAGLPLATRMVHLILGSLLHLFDWRVEGDVDLSEKFGITLQKAMPLLAFPTPRLPSSMY